MNKKLIMIALALIFNLVYVVAGLQTNAFAIVIAAIAGFTISMLFCGALQYVDGLTDENVQKEINRQIYDIRHEHYGLYYTCGIAMLIFLLITRLPLPFEIMNGVFIMLNTSGFFTVIILCSVAQLAHEVDFHKGTVIDIFKVKKNDAQ